MSEILAIVRNVSIFMLFATIITNLFASSSYQKYFSFVIGLIVIAIIVTPVIRLFSSEDGLNQTLEKSLYQVEEQEFIKELRMASTQSEDGIESKFRGEIEKEIEAEVLQKGTRCKTTVKLHKDTKKVQSITLGIEGSEGSYFTLIRALSQKYEISQEAIKIEGL